MNRSQRILSLCLTALLLLSLTACGAKPSEARLRRNRRPRLPSGSRP